MPFKRPSLADLVERVITDIQSRLPGADARLRRSNLNVLARVEAAVAHGLYGFISWLAAQVIIDTAEGAYLERWAAVWSITRKPSAAAAGAVTFTGVDGSEIPAGTVVQRADGAQFTTAAAATIAGGSAVATVQAVLTGVAGNTAAGTQLVLAAQVLGVSAVVKVDAIGLVGGADVETDDALRDRLLLRIRKVPQGGAAHDYEAWALQVPGVTRVWVYPLWMGPGTVGVLFVRDGDITIIPDAAEVAAVAAHIQPLRPVTAEVFVVAPTPRPVDITLHVEPDTVAVRTAVQAELVDLFRRQGQPGGTIRLSHLNEAVSLAEGETDHVISAPVADTVAGAGEIPVLGAVTWV